MYKIILISTLLIHVRAHLAVLQAISESTEGRSTRYYCVSYGNQWDLQLPTDPSHHVWLGIPRNDEQDGCHNFSTTYDQSAVLVTNANCSVKDKLRTAQFADVDLLIISGTLDTKEVTDPPVTMVMISEENANSLDYNTMVAVYLPKSGIPYGGIILLFSVAMVTLIAASTLANEPYKFLRNGLLYRNGKSARINKLQLTIWQTVLSVLFFVVMVITILVLLYYFYTVIVYVAIGIYCLLCMRSVYSLLSPFVALVSLTSQWRLPPNKWPILQHQPDPRFFLTVLFSVAVVTTWCVLRHASYAWILHDVLGFMFICFAVKQFKLFLSYLWPLALLMIVLFVYDVFFVFVTPLFTKDSVSIMEAVATGQGTGSHEKIPFLFQVPRLMHHTSLEVACHLVTPMLLGYGDVGLPAVLASFALHMDKTLHPKTMRVYYIITVTGYAVGFLLCLIGLMLMKTGQPALLYLVPCTLVPLLVAAMIRGDLLIMWRGKKVCVQSAAIISQANKDNELSELKEKEPQKDKKCDDIEQSPLLDNVVT